MDSDVKSKIATNFKEVAQFLTEAHHKVLCAMHKLKEAMSYM